MTPKNHREVPTDPHARADLLVNQIERFGILIERNYPAFAERAHEQVGRLLKSATSALRNALLQPCEWQISDNEKPGTHSIERYALHRMRTIKYQAQVFTQEVLMGYGGDDCDDE